MRKIKEGQVYRHFKGTLYRVITIAKDTESLNDLVIYEGNSKVWARDKKMFLSRVDKEKYPECDQEYRFELVDND